MEIAVTLAAFVVIAATIYFVMTLVLKRMDARYERQSTEFRRKNSG
jgi:ABC-type amino acid transport system permease subunit